MGISVCFTSQLRYQEHIGLCERQRLCCMKIWLVYICYCFPETSVVFQTTRVSVCQLYSSHWDLI